MFGRTIIFLFCLASLASPQMQGDQDFDILQQEMYMRKLLIEELQPEKKDELDSEIEPIQVTFEPLHKAVLSSMISSPVLKIRKQLGVNFKKNDVLVELDNTIYRANVEKGKAALNKAKSMLNSKRKLYSDGISSLFELVEAEALVAQAESELTLAIKQLLACTIRAPYDGKIASLLISEFELPQVGQPLIEIVGDDIILGKMLIDASYWNKIYLNQELDVHVNETGQRVKAKVVRIGPMIDLASSTIKVEAEIGQRDSELIGGMTGKTIINSLDTSEISSKEVSHAAAN